MFDVLSNLVKATVGVVVETPVALVADVVTLGGSLNDKEQPYTATAVEKVIENLSNATK